MKAVAELVEQQEYAAAIELIEHAEIAVSGISPWWPTTPASARATTARGTSE